MRRHSLRTITVILCLLALTALPLGLALADGDPTGDTPADVPPTAPPPAETEPAAAAESAPEAASADQAQVEQISEEQAPAEVPAEAAGFEESPAEPAVEAPGAESPPEAAPAGPAPAEEIPDDVSPAEILAAARAEEVTLNVVDENGAPLPLVTIEAAEALTSAGSDPYFWDGTQYVGYSASGVCPPVVSVCNTTPTPVQAAIDAAPNGATITIEAGVYTEQVVVDNKAITLEGQLGAVIRSPVSLATTFTAGGNPYRPIITARNNATLTVRNLTVDGAGEGNGDYRFTGIAFYNAGGAVENTAILDVRETPLSGTQHGVGIYAYNTDGTARTIDITGNTISGYQKNGMALSGAGLTVNVDGNTVTGAGPMGLGLPAQNGIQISLGATGSVTNNTVSGNQYTASGTLATDILLYQASGTVTVSGNTLSNTNAGVYSYQTAAIITGNTITGADYAGIVMSENPAPATVSNNTVTGSGIGIELYNGDATISGNTISGNGRGIIASYGAAQITGNTITGNAGEGVLVDDPASAAHGNTITGNGRGVVYNTSRGLGGDVDATGNWWGDPNGPFHPLTNPTATGDEVSDHVLYDPWLTAGPVGPTAGDPFWTDAVCTDIVHLAVFRERAEPYHAFHAYLIDPRGRGSYLAPYLISDLRAFRAAHYEDAAGTAPLFGTMTAENGLTTMSLSYLPRQDRWMFTLWRADYMPDEQPYRIVCSLLVQ